jgi:hypothetical protein
VEPLSGGRRDWQPWPDRRRLDPNDYVRGRLPIADANGHAKPDSYGYFHAYADRDPYCDGDSHTYPNSYCDCDGNRHSYAYCDSNSNADSNAYLDTNSHANSDAYCNGNSYGYTDGDTNCDAYFYAGRVRSNTRLLEKPSRPVARHRVAAWQRHL